MTSARSTHGLPSRPRRFWPTTRLGTWAVGLAIANVLLVPSWRLMGPLGGFPGLVAGAAGGVLALLAIVRGRETSVSVFLAVIPLALVALFVLAEFLVGHS
jgi:hypothetical protein